MCSSAKVLLLCLLAAPALGRPQDPSPYDYAAPSSPSHASAPPRDHSVEHEALMPFEFGYTVEDSPSVNSFGHTSNSDGEQVTGQYRVLLPDCRTQVVTYTADALNGYQAEVTYEGEVCPYTPPASPSQSAFTAPSPKPKPQAAYAGVN